MNRWIYTHLTRLYLLPCPVLSSRRKIRIHHHHHHLISFLELGHLLTRSGLTYPEVSWKVYHDSFCHLGSSILLPWVIYFCPASFRETCQWLKFPLSGLRVQSRVSPVVGMLPLAFGPACLGMAFYTAVTRSSFPRFWEQGIPREGEDDCWVG